MTASQWFAHYWGWVIFWCIVLGVPSAVADFTRRTLKTRHKRRVKLIRARQGTPLPPQGSSSQPALAGCPHVKVVPVRLADGTLVRWMCVNPVCGREFPPESAVLAGEDTDP